jgi:hypothetical protein
MRSYRYAHYLLGFDDIAVVHLFEKERICFKKQTNMQTNRINSYNATVNNEAGNNTVYMPQRQEANVGPYSRHDT